MMLRLTFYALCIIIFVSRFPLQPSRAVSGYAITTAGTSATNMVASPPLSDMGVLNVEVYDEPLHPTEAETSATAEASATAETSATNNVVTGPPLGDTDVPYVEVYDEPLHPTELDNDYVRVIKSSCPANQVTMFHRHSQDSLFIVFEPVHARNEILGRAPYEVELDAGAFFWGAYLSDPIIHRVAVGDRDLNAIDIEFKEDLPKSASPLLPLASTASRELCLENDTMRAYRVTVAPGEDVYSTLAAEEGLAEGSPYLIVVMRDANKLSGGVVAAGDTYWRDGTSVGEVGDKFACEDGADLMIVQPK